MSKLRLQGKVAIITGAASGIGEAAARLFASNGALNIIADIQDDLGRSVSASIPNSAYLHCDVTDESHVSAAVHHALDTYGRLDVFYSNAGIIGPPSTFLDLDLADFDRIMAVNVRGTAAAIKHAARAMRGGGSIICTASVASCVGGLGPAAYAASKHAVLGMVRAAAGELGTKGIRVNCVSPYGVATPLGLGLWGMSVEEYEAACGEGANLKGVVLKASHVADAALFLASEESAYVSGHNLMVDGGITAVRK